MRRLSSIPICAVLVLIIAAPTLAAGPILARGTVPLEDELFTSCGDFDADPEIQFVRCLSSIG